MNEHDEIRRIIKAISRLTIGIVMVTGLIVTLLIYYMMDPNVPAITEWLTKTETTNNEDPDKVENGIHVRTGLIEAEGLMSVINNCTNCHSAKLVIQNRMNEERWISTIRWMQRTQNLWDLGDQEEIIVNYLVNNYPPLKKGRRQALSDIQWYKLEN